MTSLRLCRASVSLLSLSRSLLLLFLRLLLIADAARTVHGQGTTTWPVLNSVKCLFKYVNNLYTRAPVANRQYRAYTREAPSPCPPHSSVSTSGHRKRHTNDDTGGVTLDKCFADLLFLNPWIPLPGRSRGIKTRAFFRPAWRDPHSSLSRVTRSLQFLLQNSPHTHIRRPPPPPAAPLPPGTHDRSPHHAVLRFPCCPRRRRTSGGSAVR